MRRFSKIIGFVNKSQNVRFQNTKTGIDDEISKISILRSRDEIQDKIETKSKHVKSKLVQPKLTVAVEGNIGCGKTTFLDLFSSNKDIKIYSEPVVKWRNLQGHNLLGLMYKDPQKWGLTFQTYVQFTMTQLHNQTQIESVKMTERSIFSAKYCFVENLYQQGLMPEADYLVLTEWFNWLIQNTNINVDLFIYLRTTPENVFERVKSRGRPEENRITLDFLKIIHELHEDWLITKKNFSVSAPVFVLDGNCEKKNIQKLYEKTTEHISLQKKIKLA